MEIGTECHWHKRQSTRPVETKTELVGSPDVKSIYRNTYIHTHTHTHIHTYIHTYTHTRARARPGSVLQITRDSCPITSMTVTGEPEPTYSVTQPPFPVIPGGDPG